jgi:phosphoribosylformimino-5-aminoimidazole carboxamide ribotide isomerase
MASTFELIPAIDLRGGRVVRLRQGDFDRETVFDADPGAVARRFSAAGAGLLHVVDLDGARAGAPTQLTELGDIVEQSAGATRVEAAGGIRSAENVEAVLAAGAHRVVFGTAAIRDPALVANALAAVGAHRVAVAVDVRDGSAVGDAWKEGARGTPPEDLIGRLADAGVEWFEVTAIDRDGLLGGPDLELLERLVRLNRGGIIASGGIRNLDDVLAVRGIGGAGAIVGRAIYDGSFDLAAAIEVLRAS